MKKILLAVIFVFSVSFILFANNEKKAGITNQEKELIEISVDATKEAFDKKNFVLIDVREQHEYNEVHIPGIKLIPLSTLESEVAKLDKKDKYITVCRSGKRSLKAREIMKNIGLNALSMKGGMNEWKEKGYPVKSGE